MSDKMTVKDARCIADRMAYRREQGWYSAWQLVDGEWLLVIGDAYTWDYNHAEIWPDSWNIGDVMRYW